jgi:hypothetical protein
MRMKRFALALIAILAFASPALAQTAGAPNDKLEFDQDGPSLSAVNGYRYDLSINGATPATITVTCTGSSQPFLCRSTQSISALGATQAGVTYQLSVTASVPDGLGGFVTSDAASLSVVIRPAPPAAPRNLRLLKIIGGIVVGLIGLFGIFG